MSVEAFNHGGMTYLDWRVYRGEPGTMLRQVKHRRVKVGTGSSMTEWGLTAMIGRMARVALSKAPSVPVIPAGLPWGEVGVTPLPVPPGGGEGGEDSSTTSWTDTPLPGL